MHVLGHHVNVMHCWNLKCYMFTHCTLHYLLFAICMSTIELLKAVAEMFRPKNVFTVEFLQHVLAELSPKHNGLKYLEITLHQYMDLPG